jgi:cullin 3
MENSGLVAMIASGKMESLARMYKLFARVETGHPEMRNALRQYILQLIRDVNAQYAGGRGSSNPNMWFTGVLEVHGKMEGILKDAFDNDKTFLNTIDDAMLRVLNENQKFPEFVSLFVDQILRNGVKGVF